MYLWGIELVYSDKCVVCPQLLCGVSRDLLLHYNGVERTVVSHLHALYFHLRKMCQNMLWLKVC